MEVAPTRSRRRAVRWPAILALLLFTAWLYTPSLGFGFWWDDPIWFGRVVGQPVAALIRPMTDFQFYRPGTMLYNRLFLRGDNTFAPPLLHAAQVGWHLLNVALVYALARRLRLAQGTAVAIAGLFALYPFSHQAVAWAAPQQPLALALQNAAWLAYLAVRRQRVVSLAGGLSLLFFLLALTVQESTVVMAVVPLLLEGALYRGPARQAWRHRPFRRALVYLGVAAGFALVWLQLPRQAGYTALSLERPVFLYFLQGIVFPWLGRPSGYEPGYLPEAGWLVLLAGLTIAVLLILGWYAGRGRQALFGLAWATLGVAPGLVGLSYSYVSLASRLFYYAAPGMALLWGCALWPPAVSRWRPAWGVAGPVLLAFVAAQSIRLVLDFQAMYAVGTSHLAELTAVTAESGAGRRLFVNFPDRYALRRPPYPLGYWGVTLAPVVVDLGAFQALVTGQHPDTESYSLPWIDVEARDAGPYQIDLRGAITPAETLYRLAGQADGVYLSRYTPAGRFTLLWAGTRVPGAGNQAGCEAAVWAETVCLQAAAVEPQPEGVVLRLTWLSLIPAEANDTIFVHLSQPGQPPIAQADGDTWLGMLPLSAWQPGDLIQEQRVILLPEPPSPGEYVLRVGLYNRETGERLPGRTPTGEPLPDDAFTIWRSETGD